MRLITERCPDQLKMSFALWTREVERPLLLDQFDIDVSVLTVGRYLARWGLTPRKPNALPPTLSLAFIRVP